jgi:hypothetical protein
MLAIGMIVGGGVTALIFRDKQPEGDKGSMLSM